MFTERLALQGTRQKLKYLWLPFTPIHTYIMCILAQTQIEIDREMIDKWIYIYIYIYIDT